VSLVVRSEGKGVGGRVAGCRGEGELRARNSQSARDFIGPAISISGDLMCNGSLQPPPHTTLTPPLPPLTITRQFLKNSQAFSSMCFEVFEMTSKVVDLPEGKAINLFKPGGFLAISLFVLATIQVQVFKSWANKRVAEYEKDNPDGANDACEVSSLEFPYGNETKNML
jgi:hypothetical protein